jgi:UDP-2,3-diacylglucosamine hydrolase
MPTLFISDLHLEEGRPEAQQWLHAFLDGPARRADALYVLGDLFEYWIGDDALSSPAAELAPRMARLNAAGVPCYFIHGNRDFLLGPAYAAQAGLQLLPETCVVNLYGRPTLLLHGDTLCTDDADYQAFRRQSRAPAWQAAVMARPVEERLRMALAARDASMRHTGSTPPDIMDANEDTVLEAFRRHGVSRMIHGHTHRPAMHRHVLGAELVGERIVLGDWYRSASYLEVSEGSVRAVDL